MDLSDEALDRMLLSVKQTIVNRKGIPESDKIQIHLKTEPRTSSEQKKKPEKPTVHSLTPA